MMTSHIYVLALSLLSGGVLGVQPSIDNSAVNYTVVEGRTAILPCTVSNLGRHKVKVVWSDQWSTVLTFNTQRIIDDERVSAVHHNQHEWNLKIEKVKYGDQGMYTCQINTTPALLQSIMLSVVVPPSISSTNNDGTITVKEGERATLTCNATGIPRPTVTWYRQPNLRGEPRERIGHTGEVLVIHNVTRYCGGKYECLAENGVPSSVGHTTDVRVKFHPEVTLSNKRMGQSLGKDTILECIVSGYPQAEAFWKFHGKQLSSSKKYKLDIFSHNEDETKLTMTLSVKNIQPKDYGAYICTATNDMGTASEKMILHEHRQRTKRPPTTTTTSTTTTTTIYRHLMRKPNQPSSNLSTRQRGRGGKGKNKDVINDEHNIYKTPQSSRSQDKVQITGKDNNSAVLTEASEMFLVIALAVSLRNAVVAP
ncbi:lachesin [Aplysia californica]|uniref:Lachesin n=1 Tax=Aplysia californica TaxID=6500 RepID=A0ABM0ZYH1_APLCA|nr:lachesin [Aplysia californica]